MDWPVWADLGWVILVSTGLDWVGLGWGRLGKVQLDWAGLGWAVSPQTIVTFSKLITIIIIL